jgi:hypothetical protein
VVKQQILVPVVIQEIVELQEQRVQHGDRGRNHVDMKRVSLEDLIKRDGRMSRRQLAMVRSWLEADWEAADVDRRLLKLIQRLVATAAEGPGP